MEFSSIFIEILILCFTILIARIGLFYIITKFLQSSKKRKLYAEDIINHRLVKQSTQDNLEDFLNNINREQGD